MLSKLRKLSLQGLHFFYYFDAFVFLEHLFVEAEYRAQGLGRFLLKKVLKGPRGDTFEDYGFPKPKIFI